MDRCSYVTADICTDDVSTKIDTANTDKNLLGKFKFVSFLPLFKFKVDVWIKI